MEARELRKHGIRIRLSGQPFAILCLLLEQPGEIVTRAELQKRLWPADTFVDFEQGLNGAMKKLRTALGDSPENPRYVETVPRLGYRFIAPVASNGTPASPTTTAPANVATPVASEERFADSSVVSRTPRRTARSTILLGAAFLLVATVAGWALFRRTPTHLTSNDTVVLADFENSTNERVFDDALRQGLLAGMEQSPFFQVLSDRQSALIFKQMGHSPDEHLAGQTAIELCQRAGSKVAVQGAISRMGANYLVGLVAYRCDTGEAVAHEQVQAANQETVLAALDQATTHLRKRLGESVASIQKYNAPIEQATTPSLEALHSYGLALTVSAREGDRSAIPFFTRAIELDGNFAMAYGRLAAVYDNLGESQLASENASKALAHADHATASEKLLIEAWYNLYTTGNLEKAAELLEVWRKNFPPTADALNDLAAVQGNLGHYEKSVAILQEALRLDPTDATPYANLATGLLALNRSEEADAVLAEADQRKLQTDFLLQVKYGRAFLRQDERGMQEIAALAPSVAGAQALILEQEADTEAYFGRFKKARQYSEAAASLQAREGDRESAALCWAVAALREAEIGESTQSRAYATKALQSARNGNVLALVALASAQTNDGERAQALLTELSNANSTGTLVQKYWLPLLHARLELRQRQPQKALQALATNSALEYATTPGLNLSTLYPIYVRGEIYLEAGGGAPAEQEFRKLLEHPGMGLNFPLQSLAYLQVARAQVRAGEPAKARESYQTFLSLWKDADAELGLLQQARKEWHALPVN